MGIRNQDAWSSRTTEFGECISYVAESGAGKYGTQESGSSMITLSSWKSEIRESMGIRDPEGRIQQSGRRGDL